MNGPWGSVLAELIPLALVVAGSPLSIIPAVLLVLQSARPRATGLSFLGGWLLGLAVVTLLFVRVPHLLGDAGGESPQWSYWVRVILGVLLIVAGIWRWLTRGKAAPSPAWLERVGAITPAGAGLIGIVLVAANPKVLFMCAAAGLVIGSSLSGAAGTALAVAFFTAIAGSTAAVPILAYVVAADRLEQPLERLKEWLQRQHAVLTAVILVALGAVLLITGLVSVT